ncbi:unnamed protein product [Owenia fusiformis]|uniref:Coilin n=1 Tax=Owenia fusiformis TaxID=6347 RepID=A0A8J1UQ12_OWEFU|nr:unnamed protein product [Owenia fusiformis]
MDDFQQEVIRRFGLKSSNTVNCFLDNVFIPKNESMCILRDNDLVVCEGVSENGITESCPLMDESQSAHDKDISDSTLLQNSSFQNETSLAVANENDDKQPQKQKKKSKKRKHKESFSENISKSDTPINDVQNNEKIEPATNETKRSEKKSKKSKHRKTNDDDNVEGVSHKNIPKNDSVIENFTESVDHIKETKESIIDTGESQNEPESNQSDTEMVDSLSIEQTKKKRKRVRKRKRKSMADNDTAMIQIYSVPETLTNNAYNRQPYNMYKNNNKTVYNHTRFNESDDNETNGPESIEKMSKNVDSDKHIESADSHPVTNEKNDNGYKEVQPATSEALMRAKLMAIASMPIEVPQECLPIHSQPPKPYKAQNSYKPSNNEQPENSGRNTPNQSNSWKNGTENEHIDSGGNFMDAFEQMQQRGVTVFSRQNRRKRSQGNNHFRILSKEEQLNTISTNVSMVLQNPIDGAVVSVESALDPEAKDTTESDCATVEKEAPVAEPCPAVDYTKYPILSSPPRDGDTIAYKVMELSETCEPGISDYKVGKVLHVDPLKLLVSIQLNQAERKIERRFDMTVEYENVILTDMCTLAVYD